MIIAVDSNVLCFLADPRSVFYVTANTATGRLSYRGDSLLIFPQNLIEFWAVATKPVSSNGLGFTTLQATEEITKIKTLFHLLPENHEIYPEWQRLVTVYQISGKNVHDARLVAQMNVHGIANILTFNIKDFRRFANINVIEPESV